MDHHGDQNHPASWLGQWLYRTCHVEDPRLNQQFWGLTFPNPLGLAPGFDKNGAVFSLWPSLGFGFAELGTVTHHPQPGNPSPRMFRLPQDQATLNRMGFNNQGAQALAIKFQQARERWPTLPVLGVNIGKSKVTPLLEAVADYQASFRLLQPWGDYFVVNVSSPNTPGLRSLQQRDQLEPILASLQHINTAQKSSHKPLLVKIAPDLDWQAIATVVDLVREYELAGVVATNTTIRREGLTTQTLSATGRPLQEEVGGIGGAPLRQRSTEIIHWIWQYTGGTVPIIGVGGIFCADDAWDKIVAGASLLQVYTGLVYEGPWMVPRILRGLLAKLDHHGLSNLNDAVGMAHRREFTSLNAPSTTEKKL